MARQVSEDERRARAAMDRQQLANRTMANMGNPQIDLSNPWSGNQAGFNQWMQNQSANLYDQYVNQFSQGINSAPGDTEPGVREGRVAAEAARLEQFRPSPVPPPTMPQSSPAPNPMAYSASVPIPAPITPGRPVVGAGGDGAAPGSSPTGIPAPTTPSNMPNVGEDVYPFMNPNGGMLAAAVNPSTGQVMTNPRLGTPLDAIQGSISQMYPSGIGSAIPLPTQTTSSSSSQSGGFPADMQPFMNPNGGMNAAAPDGRPNPLLQSAGNLASSFFQQGSGPMASSFQSSGQTPGTTIPAPRPLTGSAAGQGQAGTIPGKKSFGQMQPNLGRERKPMTYQRGVR